MATCTRREQLAMVDVVRSIVALLVPRSTGALDSGVARTTETRRTHRSEFAIVVAKCGAASELLSTAINSLTKSQACQRSAEVLDLGSGHRSSHRSSENECPRNQSNNGLLSKLYTCKSHKPMGEIMDVVHHGYLTIDRRVVHNSMCITTSLLCCGPQSCQSLWHVFLGSRYSEHATREHTTLTWQRSRILLSALPMVVRFMEDPNIVSQNVLHIPADEDSKHAGVTAIVKMSASSNEAEREAEAVGAVEAEAETETEAETSVWLVVCGCVCV